MNTTLIFEGGPWDGVKVCAPECEMVQVLSIGGATTIYEVHKDEEYQDEKLVYLSPYTFGSGK